ncbi:MAG: 16S rRNA (guanine(527)-N(7))-methyltransferase RsmG [Bacilli bacterium]|nr:16S rRNA (guanine(527)-N(7))-methyltransferase RsmG [Bacilli bacterium]
MNFREMSELLSEKGIVIDPACEEKFNKYAALLKEWNEKMNLTSIVEEGEVYEKHFYDSLLIAHGFDFKGKKIADIGSGAGFPGMALAIAFPEAKVTLIDATKKKFLFLEEVQKQCDVKNVFFHVGRVEDMKMRREYFDVVTSRGFAALRIFAEVGAPLLKVGGTLIAMKGSKGADELHEATKALTKLSLQLSDSKKELLSEESGTRINYYFTKKAKTIQKYPRPWAEIVAKPL